MQLHIAAERCPVVPAGLLCRTLDHSVLDHQLRSQQPNTTESADRHGHMCAVAPVLGRALAGQSKIVQHTASVLLGQHAGWQYRQCRAAVRLTLGGTSSRGSTQHGGPDEGHACCSVDCAAHGGREQHFRIWSADISMSSWHLTRHALLAVQGHAAGQACAGLPWQPG